MVHLPYKRIHHQYVLEMKERERLQPEGPNQSLGAHGLEALRGIDMNLNGNSEIEFKDSPEKAQSIGKGMSPTLGNTFRQVEKEKTGNQHTIGESVKNPVSSFADCHTNVVSALSVASNENKHSSAACTALKTEKVRKTRTRQKISTSKRMCPKAVSAMVSEQVKCTLNLRGLIDTVIYRELFGHDSFRNAINGEEKSCSQPAPKLLSSSTRRIENATKKSLAGSGENGHQSSKRMTTVERQKRKHQKRSLLCNTNDPSHMFTEANKKAKTWSPSREIEEKLFKNQKIKLVNLESEYKDLPTLHGPYFEDVQPLNLSDDIALPVLEKAVM